MKNKFGIIFPVELLLRFSPRCFLLAILATVVLSGCGSGGGGNPEGQPSGEDNPSANSTTAVVNQSGGDITLNDGSIVTFDPGTVKDGTVVTINTLPPETPTSSEISSLSSRLRITIPFDALVANELSPEAGITIQIPISGGIESPVAAAVTVYNVAGVLGQSYRYAKTTLSAGAASVVFYGKVGATATSIAKKIYRTQMESFWKSVGLATVEILTVDWVVEKVQPNVPTAGTLFEIRGVGDFKDSLDLPKTIVPAGKLPLILVHGIQVGCDGNAEAYKATWEKFVAFFFLESNQKLRDKYQLYTFSYQTDLSIEGNGRLLATVLKDAFKEMPSVIVAHSMGGLVTRSAMVQHADIGAQIGGVITLGTPHHGTKLVHGIAGLIDTVVCLLATESPGADDLAWDNFDDSSKACGNDFLCGLEKRDSSEIKTQSIGINIGDNNNNYKKYIPYAGVWNPISLRCEIEAAAVVVPNLKVDAITFGMCAGAAILKTVGYFSDGLVPVVSARFTDVVNGLYDDKQPWSAKPRDYQRIHHASIHDDTRIFTQNPDGSDGGLVKDLLSFVPPAVKATSITHGATGVSVNTSASSTFSEAIDVSTLDTSTFTFSGPSGLVVGTVTYDVTTNTATFTPSAPLAYDATYTATITTGVKDLAGNPLALDYSWSFTTSSAVSIPPPSAPTGVAAVHGNGQVTVSWNTVSGATSYNLYWSATSPVTKASGVKIPAAASPYVHTGLTNGVAYYYVVTAVNADGESVESGQVSATHQANAGTIFSRTAIGENIPLGTATNFYQYYFMGYASLGNPPNLPNYWVATHDFDKVRVKKISGTGTCADMGSTSALLGNANNGNSGIVDENGNSIASFTNGTAVGDFCDFQIFFSTPTGLMGAVTQGTHIAAIYFAPSNVSTFVLDGSSTNAGRSVNGYNNADTLGGFAFQFCAGTCDGTFSTSKLNDTGITASQCYQTGSDVLVECGSAGAIALNNAQDGRAGRDANAATNSNTDGKLGFSFTSVPAMGIDTGGCVQDNVTGLMWEVKTADGGLRDWTKTYTNYTLSALKWNGSAYVVPTQAEIDAPTNTLGFTNRVNAQGLCGYSDWRLPTADELQSIVDYGVAWPGPTLDTIWFPNTQSNLILPGTSFGGMYWTTTPSVSDSSNAWIIYFSSGDVGDYGRSSASYVRLVRAGQVQTTPRYTVSADGQEVTDSRTNLIWRRCPEGMVFSGGTCTGTANRFLHEAALQHAAAQASSTGIAWRLPNVRELSSIADKSLFNPAIDPIVFPATQVGPFGSVFWSASPSIGPSGGAWAVDFTSGNVRFGGARSGYGIYPHVRLVRDGAQE